MQKTFYSLVLILVLLSCKTERNATGDTKQIKLASVRMTVPKSWSSTTKQGIDSKYGWIYLDAEDSALFDYGWHSDNLYEFEPIVLDSNMIDHVDSATRAEAVFVENSRGIDRDKYRKDNVKWDTIDGLRAKIVFPRQQGIGTTGVYFDSLHSPKASMMVPSTFSLRAENLKPQNEKALLDAVKTLRFPK
jgi:hypothetical protein